MALNGWSDGQSSARRRENRPHPTYRGKSGAKRSLLTEGHGVPIGLAIEGANRHDMKLVQPTIESIIVDRPKPSEEQPPGIAALRDVATPEERHEMVTILLEPEGFSYDPEWNMIAALKPRPAFLPIFRLLQGVLNTKKPVNCL
ncbi:hypothetical protein KSD_16520 [Ktedonobacter sp. SOSP1-85]|nr:hypothetical protein KSD_16520 [Ktedonobacter sp. SOSP1-85]